MKKTQTFYLIGLLLFLSFKGMEAVSARETLHIVSYNILDGFDSQTDTCRRSRLVACEPVTTTSCNDPLGANPTSSSVSLAEAGNRNLPLDFGQGFRIRNLLQTKGDLGSQGHGEDCMQREQKTNDTGLPKHADISEKASACFFQNMPIFFYTSSIYHI